MEDQLIEACKCGNLDTVQSLVACGANVHAKDDWALRWAAYNGHLPVVEFLVAHGANVHAQDDYALRWAACNGHLPVVKFLVAHGANVRARNDYALYWAASYGHLPVVEFLVYQVPFNTHLDFETKVTILQTCRNEEFILKFEEELTRRKNFQQDLKTELSSTYLEFLYRPNGPRAKANEAVFPKQHPELMYWS